MAGDLHIGGGPPANGPVKPIPAFAHVDSHRSTPAKEKDKRHTDLTPHSSDMAVRHYPPYVFCRESAEDLLAE